MPRTLPPGIRLGTAEPADAVAAFQARGDLAPTFRWTDVWQEEHAARFMVAGVAQADVLRLFRERVADAVRTGLSPADFSRAIKPELVKAGWWGDVEVTDPATGETRITRFDERRLRLIYDTNLRQSYAAGRYARAVRNARRLPLLCYRTMRDERVRASHAQWDNLVLPVEHPFWQQHYPPNAWRCRCTAFALSEKDLQRRRGGGERFRTDPPPETLVDYADPRTGETIAAPLGVDPAFAYNPGQTFLDNAAGLQRRALAAAPPADAAALVRQAARPGGQVERCLAAPAEGEAVPIAMRPGLPVVLTVLAVQRQRAELEAGTSALQAPLTAPQWGELAQAALDEGVRVPNGTRAVWVLQRGDQVVLLELETARDARGARVLQVRSLRVLTPAQAAADPEVQPLLQRAGTARGGG
jgi:hypothetical protein